MSPLLTRVLVLAALTTLSLPAGARRLTEARRRAVALVEREAGPARARALEKLFVLQGHGEGKALHRSFVDGSLGRDAARFAGEELARLERSPRRRALALPIRDLREARAELARGALGASSQSPARLLGYRFDARRYREHIEILAGERPCTLRGPGGERSRVLLDDRRALSPASKLPQTIRFLRQYYEGLGLEVREERFAARGKTLSNLVVTIPGRSRETLVLGAHMDTALDERAKRPRDGGAPKVAPGADDNGTGVATLMEAARAYRGLRPEKTIELVHFSLEEDGKVAGSRAFVERARREGRRVAGAVIVDAIGFNREGRSRVMLHTTRGETSLFLGSELARAASNLRTRLRPVGNLPSDGRPISVNDTDSWRFAQHGIPAVFVNEDFRWRRGIHDRFDTTERIDLPFAGRIVAATLEGVARLASAGGLPR
jgi:hypothetical protein